MRTYFSQRYVDFTDSDVDLTTSYKVPAIFVLRPRATICVLVLLYMCPHTTTEFGTSEPLIMCVNLYVHI